MPTTQITIDWAALTMPQAQFLAQYAPEGATGIAARRFRALESWAVQNADPSWREWYGKMAGRLEAISDTAPQSPTREEGRTEASSAVMARSAFDELSPMEKMARIRAGVRLLDDGSAPVRRVAERAGTDKAIVAPRPARPGHRV